MNRLTTIQSVASRLDDFGHRNYHPHADRAACAILVRPRYGVAAGMGSCAACSPA